ncbi:hypothetical protein BZG36_04017 [Bifiguratus adelaidae]|uniref:RFX-type winged-helix domain-containing protein n=1 Tax=Bifiguratus adelaidae TaxID=1938954 RepID=A0A261XYQ1_9FUNG|nr:hypothetical protein BZG36_04017 [Bifiguratus adelaidae]
MSFLSKRRRYSRRHNSASEYDSDGWSDKGDSDAYSDMDDERDIESGEAKLADWSRKLRESTTQLEEERARRSFAMCWLNAAYVTGTSSCPAIARSSVYSAYLQSCHQYGMQPVNNATLGKLIRIVFPHISTRRLGERKKSQYHYAGIVAREQASDNRQARKDKAVDTTTASTSADASTIAKAPHRRRQQVVKRSATAGNTQYKIRFGLQFPASGLRLMVYPYPNPDPGFRSTNAWHQGSNQSDRIARYISIVIQQYADARYHEAFDSHMNFWNASCLYDKDIECISHHLQRGIETLLQHYYPTTASEMSLDNYMHLRHVMMDRQLHDTRERDDARPLDVVLPPRLRDLLQNLHRRLLRVLYVHAHLYLLESRVAEHYPSERLSLADDWKKCLENVQAGRSGIACRSSHDIVASDILFQFVYHTVPYHLRRKMPRNVWAKGVQDMVDAYLE